MKSTRNNILRDPVCMRRMNKNKAYAKVKFENGVYYLCCPRCQSDFMQDPKKYVERYKEINV